MKPLHSLHWINIYLVLQLFCIKGCGEVGNKTCFHFKQVHFLSPPFLFPTLFDTITSVLFFSLLPSYALTILGGLPFSRRQLQYVTGNSHVVFTPAVKKALLSVSTASCFVFRFCKTATTRFSDEKCNKFVTARVFGFSRFLRANISGHRAFRTIVVVYHIHILRLPFLLPFLGGLT